MMQSTDAKDHMTVSPVTLLPSMGIFDAIQALLDRKISGATVIDEEGNVVGVLSEMDCLRGILGGTYHGDAGGTVADYMTSEVEALTEELSVLDVAQRLLDGNRRRFPVVKDGKFVGQYSCRSMLRAVLALSEKK